MGSPIKRITVEELSQARRLAQHAFRHFDLNAAESVLEQFRKMLTPLAQWLDIAIEDIDPRLIRGKAHPGIRRVLPVFEAVGEISQVGLARKGEWILIGFKSAQESTLMSVSSGWLAMAVLDSDVAILSKYGISPTVPFKQGEMQNYALREYVYAGLEKIEGLFREREERYQIMRHNLSFARSFIRNFST